MELKGNRYQRKKSLHNNVSSRADQGCSHNRSGDFAVGTPTWRLEFPAKFVTSCENALYLTTPCADVRVQGLLGFWFTT